MVMSRVLAIACGHEDAIELDWLRHDPPMKLAVGRCPQVRNRWPRNRPSAGAARRGPARSVRHDLRCPPHRE
jgi:hypothetical protein